MSKLILNEFHKACQKGNEDKVKKFIDEDVINLNVKGKTGEIGLHVACKNGHIEIVKLLLGTPNIKINIVDGFGYTALHWASWEGHKNIVSIIIAHSADIDVKDREGFTPLHLASRKGYVDVVKCLLNNGADPLILSNRNETAKDIAMWSTKSATTWSKIYDATDIIDLLNKAIRKEEAERLQKAKNKDLKISIEIQGDPKDLDKFVTIMEQLNL